MFEVPKDFQQNLKFRREVLKYARQSKENAREIWILCARDCKFFINTFGWLFEPRPELANNPRIPFILYPYQEDAVDILVKNMGRRDIAIPKTRDMGVSWLTLAVMFWFWMFRPMQTFLVASRTEDFVDKKADPKALMWKLDWLLNNLPSWMRPKIDRADMRLKNEHNGSVFNGSSTQDNLARGDRKTAILLDEFAALEDTSAELGRAVLDSTQSATDCRLFVSTPKGIHTAFYECCMNPEILQIKLHWTLHPIKSKGLYTDASGKPRSPWYDKQCARANYDMVRIAQELDIDHAGAAGGPFFDPKKLDEIEKKDVQQPVWRGDIEYDIDTGKLKRFYEDSRGCLKLWFKPETVFDQEIPVVMGIDVSQGIGSSASTIGIADSRNGEKLGEYADANIRPEYYASKAVALAKYFNRAFMVWDAGGPGAPFGARVEELYGNFYYHRKDELVTRDVTLKPGYYLSPQGKQKLLTEYRRALVAGEFVQRSAESLAEARRYIFVNGKPEYQGAGTRTDDTSGAGANHGDRVIADALTWHGIKERPAPEIEVKTGPKKGTLAYRLKLEDEQARVKDEEMVSLDF